MLFSIVDALDILKVDLAIAILVKFLEGAFDQQETVRAHGADDCAKELVVADGAVLVDVEYAEQEVGLLRRHLDAVVLYGLHELLVVDQSVVVVVDDLEDALKVEDATRTSLSHLVAEFLEDLLISAAGAALCAVLLLDVDLLAGRSSCNASRLHLLS